MSVGRATSTPAPRVGFVTRVGTKLYLNGKPYRFKGLNYYNTNSKGAASSCGYDSQTGTVLSDGLAATGPGQNVIRAFFQQRLAIVSGAFDWTAFDKTLAIAAAYGTKVVAMLSTGTCDNSPAFGTLSTAITSGVNASSIALSAPGTNYPMPAGWVLTLVNPSGQSQGCAGHGRLAAGVTAIPVTTFTPSFTFPIGSWCTWTVNADIAWYQTGYKTVVNSVGAPGDLLTFRGYVAAVVTRYKDNPAILMWQLGNEQYAPRNDGTCPTSADEKNAALALRAYCDDLGGLIHSIDPNHLVNLGTMGTGNCGCAALNGVSPDAALADLSMGNYQYVHASPGIDLCEYHDYGSDSTAMPGDVYNGLQRRLNQAAALNKPLFVGESGIRRPRRETPTHWRSARRGSTPSWQPSSPPACRVS